MREHRELHATALLLPRAAFTAAWTAEQGRSDAVQAALGIRVPVALISYRAAQLGLPADPGA